MHLVWQTCLQAENRPPEPCAPSPEAPPAGCPASERRLHRQSRQGLSPGGDSALPRSRNCYQSHIRIVAGVRDRLRDRGRRKTRASGPACRPGQEAGLSSWGFGTSCFFAPVAATETGRTVRSAGDLQFGGFGSRKRPRIRSRGSMSALKEMSSGIGGSDGCKRAQSGQNQTGPWKRMKPALIQKNNRFATNGLFLLLLFLVFLFNFIILHFSISSSAKHEQKQ